MTVTITNPQDNSAGGAGAGENIKERVLLTDAADLLRQQYGLHLIITLDINNNTDPISLSITGSAPVDIYRQILEGVYYTDTKGGSHNTTDRIVTVVVNDGTLDSATQTVTIHVAFPAGVAGEPINLALAEPSADHIGPVTLTIAESRRAGP